MTYSLDEIEMAAQWLLEKNRNTPPVWCFAGQMGAGKTTLIAAIAAILGVKEEISSPTFSLVNEYKTEDGKTLFHFDFYRIKSFEEAYDMGIEEYLDSGHLCLIEWPSQIFQILQQYPRTEINLAIEGAKRTLNVSTIEK